MAVKKFVPKAAKSPAKPIEFEVYDQKFKAVPHLQGITLLRFMEASSEAAEEGENGNSKIVPEIMPFFESALYPESYERFIALTKSHEQIVEFDDLMDILSWLINEYTDRPTSGSDK